VRLGWISVRAAGCALLMMGIVKPETCSAYKKCNKIIMASSWFFYSSIITMMHGPINIRYIQLGF